MSAKDAHYGGNLVDGAHMVHLFGDVATELLIKRDGDEGLFAGYEDIKKAIDESNAKIIYCCNLFIFSSIINSIPFLFASA